MELYEWQKECIGKWKDNHGHGIINVITGAGKTVLALSVISLLVGTLKENGQKLRVRIVVPTTRLARQWKKAMEEQFPSVAQSEGIGLFSGSRRDSVHRFCTIYVVNSARYSITRHIRDDLTEGYEVLLIADECHHYGAPENRKIFDYHRILPGSERHVYTLGLSATPDCPEYEQVLKPSLGREIFRYGFEEAVKNKTISSYRLGQIALSFTAGELFLYDEISSKMAYVSKQLREEYPFLKEMSMSDFFKAIRHLASEEEDLPTRYLQLSYQRAGISQNAAARIDCALSLIRLLDQQEQILVFCERISQAEELYKRLRGTIPGRIVRYHSGISREFRQISLDQFQNGEARILISCRALDEGVDIPSVGIGIVMSCAAQTRQRIQRLGRILRRNKSKNSAVLYYLHVKESTEDHAYLPNRTDPSRIFFLEYSREEDDFLNHSYEALAAALWEKAMKLFPKDTEKKQELRLCLQQGLVRQDWMEPVNYCEQKIAVSGTQHERNYWICMKQLSSLCRNE